MPRGKGIYRRGSVWWIRYAGPDGRIRFESSKSSNYKEAEEILVKKRKEVQDGKDPVLLKKIGNHTFKELADHYLGWAKRQRGFSSKRIFIGQLVRVFGNCMLRRMTTRQAEEYQSGFITAGKAPATANRHMATLKHMFTKAAEWEMADEETLKRIRRVKLLPENNRRLRYLSAEECGALIEACESHLRPIVITALNTGMRKEEVLSLEWEKHVDLRHGFFLLTHTKNGERREIPINANVRDALTSIVRRIDSPYVFMDAEGNRFQNVKRSFATACRKAGIKNFRFHDLRHTFASQLVMAGIDLMTVKELLGHKTLTMTLRYSHLAPAHKVAALSVLGGTLSRGSNYTKTIQSAPNGYFTGETGFPLTPEIPCDTIAFPQTRP